MDIKNLAFKLDEAALKGKSTAQASLASPFDVATAYKIQEESLKLRYQRGEEFVGFKLGFTSRAKMQQMGVNDLIYGRLTDKMVIDDGGQMRLEEFIHPRAEPEIAVLVKQKIDRPLTLLEAVNYVEAIAPAMEIIDSRYENFKFTLEDVIADNCSSSGLVLGQWQSSKTPVDNLGMVIELNQVPTAIGSSAAIMGNPWRSFIAATRLAAKYEHVIPEGSVLLLGAATAAIKLSAGVNIRTKIEKLGSIAISVV